MEMKKLLMWLGSMSVAACSATFAISCSAPKRTIRIPEAVVPNPKNKAEAKSAIQPYVIMVSNGKNVIRIEIPVGQAPGAFSTAIPLDSDMDRLRAQAEMPQTEADREIIDAKKSAGEPIAKAEPGKAKPSRSYLGTLARVKDLFKKRQYELALIELTALDREYPDDEKVLEMKGTLQWKLGRAKQARESWERVLALNPNNETVAQALEQLDRDGG